MISCFVGCAFATLTINTGEFTNMTMQSAQYYWKGDDRSLYFEPVTGQLADSTMEDLNGKIVFQEFVGKGNWLAKMKEIQSAGAIAILYGTRSLVSGQYGCALTASEPSGQITIPVAEVSQSGFDEIRHAIMNGAVMEATLTSEGNPWNMLGGIPVIIVFRFIFTTVSVGLIGFALYKLIMFIRYQRAQFNVPQVCLSLEIIANMLRIVYLAVDPFSCFGVYGGASNFLTPLSFPFEVATFMLITFYWFEAVTNASIKVYPFIDRFKPFFFAFTIIFLAVIILISVLGYFLALSVTMPIIILYVVVSVAFVVFYIVTVVKIIKKMSTSENMRKKKGKVLSEVNTKIILNGVTRLLSLVPAILYVSVEISTVPIPQYIDSVFIYTMIYLDSWARMYLFKEPNASKSSTGSNSVKSGSGTTTKGEATLTVGPPTDTQV
jgi:hypothetical protein